MDEPAPQPPTSPPEREDNYAPSSQSTADFIKGVEPLQAQQRQHKKRKFVIMIVLILLIGGGAAAYFFLLKPEDKQKASTPSPSPNSQTTEETEAETEHYVSQDLRLSLDHPKDWKVDDTTSGLLKLESPMVKLPDDNDTQTDAKVVVTLQSAGSDPLLFTKNDATATIDAEKIAYAAPSTTQRKETYLSFVSFGSSNSLDAIFISGDGGYQKGQAVPKTDIARSDPIVSITFVKCTGSTCAEKLSISPEAWGANKTLESAKAILQSFIFE